MQGLLFTVLDWGLGVLFGGFFGFVGVWGGGLGVCSLCIGFVCLFFLFFLDYSVPNFGY